ncbi:MAG: hypothetical protein ACI4WS_11515 [Oscillospiraceae bacterium]
MKKREISVLGLILFILGIAVLAVVFFMLGPLFEDNSSGYIFSCISVLVLYLAVFLPIMLGLFRGGVATAAASGSVYYKGLATYGVISLANIVLALTIFPLGISIAIQCVALFVFVIWIFMAVATKSHIESTLQDEEQKKSLVMELRSKSGRLSALAAGLDKGSSIRVSAEKLAENMRYLSPGNTKEEHDLERRMLAVLDSILIDGYFVSGGYQSPETLEGKFRDFDILYRQRKNML